MTHRSHSLETLFRPCAAQAVTATPTQTPAETPTPTETPVITPTATLFPTPLPQAVFAHAQFVYDGDGKRVASQIETDLGTTTTYFVGNYYEITGTQVTKYYYAGSQRIAMRRGGVLYYLLIDHPSAGSGQALGSTYVNGRIHTSAAPNDLY